MIGFGTRVTYAFRCFFALLFRGEIPQDIVQQILGPATPAVAKPAAAPIQAAIAAKPLA